MDPETGATGMLGAPTEQDTPLCATCIRFTTYALGSLHVDTAETTTLLAPSMQVRHRDPDLPDQPRVKLSAPVPMNLDAEAIRACIVNEVVLWTEEVAEAIGGEWDPDWASMTRLGHRVQVAASFLADHTLSLVTLPPARRRLFSTGVDPAAGHEGVEVYQGAVWADRSGADAALAFLKLNRTVRSFAGRIRSDWVDFRCPRCHSRMCREHWKPYTDWQGRESAGRVVCRARSCGVILADHEYEELRAATARAFGVRV